MLGVRKEDGRGEKGKRDGGRRKGREGKQKEGKRRRGRMMIHNRAVSLKLLHVQRYTQSQTNIPSFLRHQN